MVEPRRNALLLLLARELDPESDKDMERLWDVWSNVAWHAGTWDAIQPHVEALLQHK